MWAGSTVREFTVTDTSTGTTVPLGPGSNAKIRLARWLNHPSENRFETNETHFFQSS